MRVNPFYPEPLASDLRLVPALCGDQLEILPAESRAGWSADDLEGEAMEWLKSLWEEATSVR